MLVQLEENGMGWMRRGMGLLGLVVLAGGVAKGQLGVYGKVDFNHYSPGGSGSTAEWFYGGGVGVYDDFIRLGPLHAGVDVRGSFGSGGQQNYRNFLGGVRAAVKVPVLPLRPYAEGLVGGGGTEYTGATAAGITGRSYLTKFTYEILGGLDYTLIPHVDFRAIEIGVGRQTGVNSGASNPGTTIVAVSTGLVVRL